MNGISASDGSRSPGGVCFRNLSSSVPRQTQQTATAAEPMTAAHKIEFDATSDAEAFRRRM